MGSEVINTGVQYATATPPIPGANKSSKGIESSITVKACVNKYMHGSDDYFGYYEREFNVCMSFERGRLAMDSDGLIIEDCPNRVTIESVHEIKGGKWVEMPIDKLPKVLVQHFQYCATAHANNCDSDFILEIEEIHEWPDTGESDKEIVNEILSAAQSCAVI